VPPARQRGLATRAVRLFAERLVATGAATELVAVVDPANPASRAVAVAAGFMPTAVPGRLRRGPAVDST